ncbi:hypothetical protein M153_2800007545 [Pseudoloma neurophilia]|uniref:Uncharacterized protein n=1 Tax=Pseudoloma neurophilia TaxID=146866 RepID=A0A0R0LYJ6_9MICR|nr:hypothetical protein M153_2800007545 [Pseudoloma neurophilia]
MNLNFQHTILNTSKFIKKEVFTNNISNNLKFYLNTDTRFFLKFYLNTYTFFS